MARAVRELLVGMWLPASALGWLLGTRGLKRVAVLPLLLNIVLWCVCAYLLWQAADEWRWGVLPDTFWGSVGAYLSAWINPLLEGLKLLLLIMLGGLVAYFAFTAVGMVVASPLNDWLSERIERKLCGHAPSADFPWKRIAAVTAWSVFDSLVIVLLQAMFCLIVLPLLLIPVVGFLPFFLVNAFFAAYGFVEINMARNGLRLPMKLHMGYACFWRIMGMGITIQLMFLIPVLGLMVLPVGVTAGALLYCGAPWPAWFEEHAWETPEGYTCPRPGETIPQTAVPRT